MLADKPDRIQSSMKPDFSTEPQEPLSAITSISYEKALKKCEKHLTLIDDTPLKERTTSKLNPQDQKTQQWKHQYKNEIEIINSLCEMKSLNIDDWSLQNMACAMRFSGVDSLQKAMDLKLDIIPPGPVFHTWYAHKGTTIFDGHNNARKIDYVDRISREATLLERWKIPLFIVYTENSMTEDQIQTMRSLFKNHPNIVTLSIEHDLNDLPMAQLYQKQELHSNIYLDGIRGSVIMDYERVLSALDRKAIQEGKNEFSERLTALGNRSIIYSDIDNLLLRRPPYILSFSSFVKCPLFIDHTATHFKATGSSLLSYLPHHGAKSASKDDLETIRTNSSTLYDELLDHPFDSSNSVWCFDVGLYMVGRNFLRHPKTITERYLDKDGHYQHDFFKFKDVSASNSPLPKNHTTISRLHGLQLVKSIYVGQDQSWL